CAAASATSSDNRRGEKENHGVPLARRTNVTCSAHGSPRAIDRSGGSFTTTSGQRGSPGIDFSRGSFSLRGHRTNYLSSRQRARREEPGPIATELSERLRSMGPGSPPDQVGGRPGRQKGDAPRPITPPVG